MLHLPTLIEDLGIILAVAGVVTLLFKKIGQPVVLGYLLAGFLVGPEVSFFPTVQENDEIKIWAEIGVIVLLFGLGLEFSFKKLVTVGRGASITAITEVLFMLGLGYLLGQGFGWNTMDSIFLGGILSISSTTIIIRAFDELGFRQRRFVTLVFGVLIVEDLVAILLLVLLSTIAVSNTFEGTQLLTSAAKLAFFLTLWFLGGIFIVPWFLRKTRSLMNDETSLIVSLAMCLLMVLLATKSGFSPALGAFIMGSILAETPDGARIEHTLKSVKDLFAAVFFVSVGMLINLDALKEHWFAVAVITIVTILGKLFSSTIGALLSGQSLRVSLQTGMSLAQIGEFSFIIATLGLTLKVTSEFLYPLAVAVSAITTLTTPYLIKSSDATYIWIEKKLPADWLSRLRGNTGLENPNVQSSKIAQEMPRVFLNSVLVVGIALACSKWLLPFLSKELPSEGMAALVSVAIAMFLSLPSLWAIFSKARSVAGLMVRIEDVRQMSYQSVLGLFGRALLAIFLLGFIVAQFTSALVTFILAAGLSMLMAVLGFKNFSKTYGWFEKQFLSHLNEKDKARITNEKEYPILAPWDAHLATLDVHPNSSVVGRKLADIGIRESYGVTVAMIERGSQKILAPRRDDLLMAFDRVSVIGNDDEVSKFKEIISKNSDLHAGANVTNYGLKSIFISGQNPFIGKSIRESGIRETTDGLVVGLERSGERVLNPDATESIQDGDLLWIVGNTEKIKLLK
ncbi:MAG: sodium:proton antiporter [Bdellovibrio sp. 28-41-41]|nr:MAG: sodium:proton antiporter [Bdellovibrio sp. 28-41-41]